jgi:acyl-CoA synthetase (AMP-forming)/AMP-acid ligase II/acyl carrier protein
VPDTHPQNPMTAVQHSCLPRLLEHQAKRIPDALAILAPGRAPLTYGRLYRQIDEMGRLLRSMGIGRHDRIALVLPNGPEMAVAMLAVATIAACAPINPAYGAEEFDGCLADLGARALIVRAGSDSPARGAALARGIPVVELSPLSEAEAGLFTLTGGQAVASPAEAVGPDDVALLLLTSGTTSRPKIVPLTHGNICAQAYRWGPALALTQADRCLNVLPLFHVYGFVGQLLNSLAAGASVVCTPGCDVGRFFAWASDFRPTWYGAVPAMHQALLAEARRDRQAAAGCRLRLVLSASAALPPHVSRELERVFETVLLEFYGMTEVGPVACNPLPPLPRKVGSVGVTMGLDIVIMDERGAVLPHGQAGQILVRGGSVMAGYDGNPMASQAAFVDGWFKTGDHGFFDDDGYLFLVSRTQDIINRGGEKVAPREVDEVLLEHPAVAEAITFAVPHATLGEDIVSAVVLRPEAAAAPKDVREFVIKRLADFKVPRRVLIVGELPKDPMGKVQRAGLAARLGLAPDIAVARPFIAPRTPVEQTLTKLWAEILEVDRVGIHDDFFELGGDSLLVSHVIARVGDVLDAEIEPSHFFEAPTVAEMAARLETLIRAGQEQRPSSAIARRPAAQAAPASVAQEQVVELLQALPGLPFFNVLSALRVTSPVDVAVLQRSIDEIVRRHDILRTTFSVVDNRHLQIIAPELTVRLIVDDLHALAERSREVAGERLFQEEARHSFDLVQGPLLRVRLVRLAEQDHLLLLNLHHIIYDGWSGGVLLGELAALYDAFSAGAPSPLASLPIQFADFAHWQRSWRSHPEIVGQLAYWREQLRGPLPAMELAAARPRQPIDDLITAQRPLALPAKLKVAAKAFGHRQGGTLFMVLVAALKTLLHGYLGQADLRVATLVANRNRAATERLIGPLVNMLVLRTDIGGDPTPQEVVRRVRATTLAAFAHQDLPFEELARIFAHERALDPVTLSRIGINFQNATLRPRPHSEHALVYEEAHPGMLLPPVTATTLDVTLILEEGADGLVGTCVYKPKLFSAKVIDRLLKDYQKVLEHMVAHPQRPISKIPVPARMKPSRT